VTVACLAWGSLEWKPGSLKVQLPWRADGPILPVEYVRQSAKNHLTLVLTGSGTAVPTLWAPMTTNSVAGAVESLKVRERTKSENIGRWPIRDQYPFSDAISEWAQQKNVEAVVWTALPPKFGGRDGVAPTIDEAVAHLCSLDEEAKKIAEEYVRKTPSSVRTTYRLRFETEFGWTAIQVGRRCTAFTVSLPSEMRRRELAIPFQN
jgi:hypothetical protein